MSMVNTTAPPIAIGYEYAIRIEIEGDEAVFPEGALLRAQVRAREADETVIADLTSDNDGLHRIDERTIELRLSAQATATIDSHSVVFDLVRDDEYLYVRLKLSVIRPITRAN